MLDGAGDSDLAKVDMLTSMNSALDALLRLAPPPPPPKEPISLQSLFQLRAQSFAPAAAPNPFRRPAEVRPRSETSAPVFSDPEALVFDKADISMPPPDLDKVRKSRGRRTAAAKAKEEHERTYVTVRTHAGNIDETEGQAVPATVSAGKLQELAAPAAPPAEQAPHVGEEAQAPTPETSSGAQIRDGAGPRSGEEDSTSGPSHLRHSPSQVPASYWLAAALFRRFGAPGEALS